MQYRVYDPEKDVVAAHRIWRETGWVTSDEPEPGQKLVLRSGRTLVADIDGEAECLTLTVPGAMRYLDAEVPFAAVMAVTTSRVARKQGLAGRLTAQAIALDVADGAAVSALGIFEQGFYNRLGFGNGSYEHWIRFDPATLQVSSPARSPKRLTREHARQMFDAIQRRTRGHGAINLHSPSYLESELIWDKSDFGLGYFDGEDGALSHFIWFNAKGENGPYRVNYIAYGNRAQFLELMGVIKSFGDQVRMVRMREPAHIQIQDLLHHPFRSRIVSQKSDFATGNDATAYWQVRICDLQTCLTATHLAGAPLRFNLVLSDPITHYLDGDAPWQGVAGEYVITLGPESAAQPGSEVELPTLTASTGAFTRLWLGVRPASGLAITDDLRGPDDLLAALDRTLRLPAPHLEWDI